MCIESEKKQLYFIQIKTDKWANEEAIKQWMDNKLAIPAIVLRVKDGEVTTRFYP